MEIVGSFESVVGCIILHSVKPHKREREREGGGRREIGGGCVVRHCVLGGAGKLRRRNLKTTLPPLGSTSSKGQRNKYCLLALGENARPYLMPKLIVHLQSPAFLKGLKTRIYNSHSALQTQRCLLCIYRGAEKDIYVFYVVGMFFTVRKGRCQHFGTDKT
jgi:hypothetical protein